MNLRRREKNKEKEKHIFISGRCYLQCSWYQLCLVSPKLFDLRKLTQKMYLQLPIK